MTATPPAAPPRDAPVEATPATTWMWKLLSRYGVVVVLLALLVVAAGLAPRLFSEVSLRTTGRQAAIVGVVVIGQVLLLFLRCVDLSVAAVIGFTAVLVADGGPGLAEGLLWAVAIAVAVGLVNGWLVTRRHVPAFIATFGMLVLLEGARLAYTRGSTSGSVDEALIEVVRQTVGPVSVPVVVWLVLTAVAALLIARTVTGRRIVMAGSNEEMGRLSGLTVDRYKVAAFVVCALLAVLSGVLLAGSTGYVDRFVGRNSELDSITAALLGGARFSGGEGSFIGGAAGSLLLATLFTLIVLLGWPPALQLVVKGAVLIGALGAQSLMWRSARDASG